MANEIVKGCGFHHIALATANFEKALHFYTEGLGFSVYRAWETESGKKIALLDMGNGDCVELFSDCSKAEMPLEAAGSYFHLALKTTDARAAFERAVACGAQPHKAPAECLLPCEPPISAVIAFVKGTDGEQIEFFQTC